MRVKNLVFPLKVRTEEQGTLEQLNEDRRNGSCSSLHIPWGKYCLFALHMISDSFYFSFFCISSIHSASSLRILRNASGSVLY